jgi:hypothetical protein
MLHGNAHGFDIDDFDLILIGELCLLGDAKGMDLLLRDLVADFVVQCQEAGDGTEEVP